VTGKLDLNLLTIFLEVYRLRSITLAAESLNFTQPGISGALKRLQQQLGCELFVREGRGISPTYAATELANQLRPAYTQVNNALANLTAFDVMQSRTFNVYICETMMLLLQPLVETDEEMGNCRIQFTITPSDEEKMLNAMSLQKADLVIDIGTLNSPSYKVEPLAREELLIICSENHPRIQGSITAEQYFQEKHITLRLRRAQQTTIDYFTDMHMPDRQISSVCDSAMTIMGLVANSDSVGISSTSLTCNHARAFGLQVFDIPFETNPVTYNIMWHKRNQSNPAHRWLRSKLQQLVHKTPIGILPV
jgi:DNA-binding transcriptional LysR family regulator